MKNLKGIKLNRNAKGKLVSVEFDVKKWAYSAEDLMDIITCELLKDEPRFQFKDVIKELKQKQKTKNAV
jgi:hypothetical protein